MMSEEKYPDTIELKLKTSLFGCSKIRFKNAKNN